MAYQNSKLLTLLQAHNITDHQTHRAMDDITYLMELLKRTNPNGEPYLKETLQYGPMRKYQPAPQAEYKRIQSVMTETASTIILMKHKYTNKTGCRLPTA